MNKIKEGVENLKGTCREIPDTVRDDLPEFFNVMGYKKGVEIGVFKAEFMKNIAAAGLEIYGVDPWTPYEGFTSEAGFDIERHDFLYEHSKRVMSKYDNAHIIRKTSMEALNDFEDGSIDFVYIDGNHNFRYVAEDIVEWTKKVRIGGVVSGHDYIDPRRLPPRRWPVMHVKHIVDAYTDAYRIPNWHVLGSRQPEHAGLRKNLYRSWLWVRE